MSDPRVEAVADRIEEILPGKLLLSFDRDFAIDMAQAAIEASDAWLKERGWKAVPIIPDGQMKAEGWDYFADAETCWERMIEASPPTPEDTDR